jgi:tRNA G46 methylase TrmB
MVEFETTEIELGCGTGVLLAELASWHPRRRYVGVELDRDRAGIAAHRIKRRHLWNARVIHGEAQDYISHLRPNSIDVIHVYHPTPHPQTVGLRYRLVTSTFEQLVYRALRPWGRFRLATDHSEYFFDAMRNFGNQQWWATDWKLEPPALIRGALVGSPVEMEYRRAGVTEFFAAELVAVGKLSRPSASLQDRVADEHGAERVPHQQS